MTHDQEALQPVESALAQFAAAQKSLEAARGSLREAIVTAVRAGVRQSDLVRTTGLSREHIRRLTRAAGISA